MKNLKLEVGKTYLNRKGERVKIEEETGGAMFPFEGDDCFSYKLDGRYWHDSRDSVFDLIAEADAQPEKRTFKIPENTREISVSETDGRIIIEFVPEDPEFKEGDICINYPGSVYVFKSSQHNGLHNSFCWFGANREIGFNKETIAGRLATLAEAQRLFDALAKDGKQWNPETMKIEELTEPERIRAFFRGRRWGISEALVSGIEQYIKEREAQQ